MITGIAMAEFGTGDIGLGISVDEFGAGVLGYQNQKIRPIGEELDRYKEWSTKDAQLVMIFNKIESIDVVISKLQEVRALMQERIKK